MIKPVNIQVSINKRNMSYDSERNKISLKTTPLAFLLLNITYDRNNKKKHIYNF
jgi:hypothetical protein